MIDKWLDLIWFDLYNLFHHETHQTRTQKGSRIPKRYHQCMTYFIQKKGSKKAEIVHADVNVVNEE